jgi:hypothetical protein
MSFLTQRAGEAADKKGGSHDPHPCSHFQRYPPVRRGQFQISYPLPARTVPSKGEKSIFFKNSAVFSVIFSGA